MALRRLLVASAALALLLAAGAAALWLSVRKDLADPDPAKARREVQRFYDRRSPGRYVVLDCAYSDQVDSDYDNFKCRIARPCRQPQRFSVPRAAAGVGRFDADPTRAGRGRPC